MRLRPLHRVGWKLWLLEADGSERQRQSEKEIAITLDKISFEGCTSVEGNENMSQMKSYRMGFCGNDQRVDLYRSIKSIPHSVSITSLFCECGLP